MCAHHGEGGDVPVCGVVFVHFCEDVADDSGAGGGRCGVCYGNVREGGPGEGVVEVVF